MKSITAKRARRAGRGWTGARCNRPDVVRCSPQTLIPSSPGTTSSGSKAPVADRTWCAAPRKPLFLRRRAPRLPGPRHQRRGGRGAPRPANPYSFVAEHHVFRGQGANGGADVVRRSPQILIPSSPSTTSSESKAPAAGGTWCVAPRKPLFFRRRAPRLPGPRRRRRGGRGASLPANPYSFVTGHHVFRVQGAGVGVARRWNMASRRARRQHGRLWGETNLRLGAKETEDQGLAGIRAPSPWRPRAENGLRLGARKTEEQGFAEFRAPSLRRPRAENGPRLGAQQTEEQGFAGIHAPSPRRPRAGRFRFFISNSMTFLRIRKN